MQKFLKRILFAAVCIFPLLMVSQVAYSAEKAVLLPIVGEFSPHEKMELADVLVKGLASRFEVIRGAKVDQFVKQTFQEESKKTDCDEAHCYQRIALKYQADKIIAFRITKVADGHYLVLFNLYDVTTGEMTMSRSQQCSACTFQKLKAIGSDLIKAP
jgi:ribosomal protein L37AE/L43A